MSWEPTRFVRFVESIGTSTYPARIETDQGEAYVKVINNPLGPQVLARELIGCKLAHWFGLSTFDCAILDIQTDDEIWLADGRHAEPGPAFATRAIRGHTWGGREKELRKLENPEDIPRLVIFDTWILNADRHPPDGIVRKPNRDNVFLSSEGVGGGRARLVAMDHSECFISSSRALDKKVSSIERIRDEHIYGLFPEFMPFVAKHFEEVKSAASKLANVRKSMVSDIVKTVPTCWQVSLQGEQSLVDLVKRRADFLSDRIVEELHHLCRPGELPF